ncbi:MULTISPECIES: pentapeptide repeat-containing protein [Brevibacterium]|uniref:Pentapeptide repeat-containing protein n=1 Tax=Brevibacterium casei TaxID=33889 RepID=A0A7T4DJ06_9MICO|nr:pentapeptide repeat-containing protein [Brevibacterium casei]QQB13941.1 pentapeptide repeat-containing protein [Brevibacterium casei]
MTTAAPKPPTITHGQLAQGLLGDIGSDEFLEGLDFTDLDLAEADAKGATFLDSALTRVTFGGSDGHADLTGARLSGVRLTDSRADTLMMPRANLVHTEVSGCRIGAGVCYDSVWEKVVIDNCRISYLNLRSAKLTDVEFRGCAIDELDLDMATATRVAFPGSTVGSLQLAGSTLRSVDLRGLAPHRITGIQALRGATIDDQQLMVFAELFARELGIIVERACAPTDQPPRRRTSTPRRPRPRRAPSSRGSRAGDHRFRSSSVSTRWFSE